MDSPGTRQTDTTTTNTKPETNKPETAAQKPEVPAGVNIIRMPKLSDTMTEGVVAKWNKKVGDKVVLKNSPSTTYKITHIS